MKFRTEIDINSLATQLDYGSHIFAVGSCFADVVGGRLGRSKFNIEVNPTGVLFNPVSIAKAIQRYDSQMFVASDELQEGREGWFHYDFHSSLSASTREECVERINSAVSKAHESLQRADCVILTLGTAWIYELAQSGEVVANCHKQPAGNFVRRRLSVEEIVSSLTLLIEGPFKEKRIILTLSPIRHVADGLAENSLSKATLRVAIEEVVARYGDEVSYFPSYEILMDDLRDYRFYGEDMVHPSSVAVDYVWHKFCEVALTARAREVMKRVEGVVRASQHRPSNPQSESHKRFCQSQLRVIEELCSEVDLESERQYFAKGAQ